MGKRVPATGAEAVISMLDGASGLDAAERLARPTPALRDAIEETRTDAARLIVDLYERHSALSAERRTAGVFYTPSPVIEAMLDRLPSAGTWLDPAAGAGAFAVAFVRRHGMSGLHRFHACDIDAAALEACALALEAALGRDARSDVERWRKSNAHIADFLRSSIEGVRPDVIVGNPPYGLSDDPGLTDRFPDLRGERDLYACFLLRAIEVVRSEGLVSLLVPDTWLTNRRATALRQALASAGVARIVDFGKPFAAAKDTRVHAVTVRPGASRCEVESTRNDSLLPMASVPATHLRQQAGRGWFLYRTSAEAAACRMIEKGRRLGDHFEVLYGLRTGDNEAHVRTGPGSVPLVGGRDLDAYDRRVSPKHLTDPTMFAKILARQRGRPKLGIQRIRTNSKLSWRRWIEAAPLLPEEVGLDSLTLVAGEDDPLWALLGVLCSSVMNRWYRLTFTDVNVKPAYIQELPLPELSLPLSRMVQARVRRGPDLQLERAIDRLVIEGFGLDANEAHCLEEGFWQERLRDLPLPTLADAHLLARTG